MSAEIKVTRPILNCVGDKAILETFRATEVEFSLRSGKSRQIQLLEVKHH